MKKSLRFNKNTMPPVHLNSIENRMGSTKTLKMGVIWKQPAMIARERKGLSRSERNSVLDEQTESNRTEVDRCHF